MRPALTPLLAVVTLLVLGVSTAHAEVFFHEKFETLHDWVVSKHKTDYGKFELAPAPSYVKEKKPKGLKLIEDSHYYAISKKLPTAVDNDGKHFIISFSVRNEQNLKCGGTYIKLFSELDQVGFHDASKYWLMFGPDRCGPKRVLHIIFNHKGENLEWEKKETFPDDKLSHVYTLDIAPGSTYKLYVDGVPRVNGTLEQDWKFLESKTLPDPTDVKPDDWCDEKMMDNPDDVKPAGWDDEPAVIPDTEAKKPVDWKDDEDGEWAAPEVPNPKYKGEWSPTRIPNPNYKGPWEQRQIPNPKYSPDPNLYRMPAPIQYIGIDVLQVESGSVFGDIIIGDDVDEVLKIVGETYGSIAEQEKEEDKKLSDVDSTEPQDEIADDAQDL